MSKVVRHDLIAGHFVGAPAGDDPAFKHAHDAIGHGEGALQILLDEHDRCGLCLALASALSHQRAK